MPLDDGAVQAGAPQPQKDDNIRLEFIEENLQRAENPEVQAIIDDLNFVINRYIMNSNEEIQKIMGQNYWLTASLDLTVVEVEPMEAGG